MAVQNSPIIDIPALEQVCLQVRRNILDLTYYGKASHLGGSLSCVEILVALYFVFMRVDPKKPNWAERDRFILSKGHAAPGLYSVMAERGFFPRDELRTFCHDGTRLQKHLDMHKLPGVDASSGSLGLGLSIGVGMTLADRLDRKDRYVFVLLGDGEVQEGQVWEAAMTAGFQELDHLIAIIDCNKLQVDGFTRNILDIEPLMEKWSSFRWDVQRVDGNQLEQVIAALSQAKEKHAAPQLIIADTVKGKGVDFMESKVEWHSKGLTEGEYQNAIAQLDEANLKLEHDEN